jgi:hypothetical protein
VPADLTTSEIGLRKVRLPVAEPTAFDGVNQRPHDGSSPRSDSGIVESSAHKTEGSVDPVAPLFTLRGAAVAVDSRRASRVVIILCLLSLAATSAALFVVGARKNAQIGELRNRGVSITVTVTRCIGLLSGSGSNAAGYSCRGSYAYHGTRYEEAIPGNVSRLPGSTLPGVIAPDDPALLSTPAVLRSEQVSWRVFIAPGVLGLVAAAGAALLFGRVRHRRTESQSAVRSAPH